ncbi:hypothetical protein ACJJTC_009504 [Scirpophaga incertulas]
MNLQLINRASDQNVYLTYGFFTNKSTCHKYEKFNELVDRYNTEAYLEDKPIRIERSKAVHKLLDARNENNIKQDAFNESNNYSLSHHNDSESSEFYHPNASFIKLNNTDWLTPEQICSPNYRSPSISPSLSSSSISSKGSDDEFAYSRNDHDKYLSTVLRVDREHNLFGLSNRAIVGFRPWVEMKNIRSNKPTFPQTAIILFCCKKGCCRHQSQSDLPPSLKCEGCRRCCMYPIGCCKPTCVPCISSKCLVDCTNKYGMTILINRKPKYELTPDEITPRSSCILSKPVAARSCHHVPPCVPPSSVFPYLLPCYWPARPSAPCSEPARCFHNPPCMPARRPKPKLSLTKICPPKCEDSPEKCQNPLCLGVSKQ